VGAGAGWASPAMMALLMDAVASRVELACFWSQIQSDQSAES
jgi:hypothetical protein